jgi:hypothetical protein
MDDKAEALCRIAGVALNALVADEKDKRHRELWKLALARVWQTKRDIEADLEIREIRKPPPRAPRET